MRHTRNRQLIKATKHTGWNEARVLTIEYMRKAVPDIDPTFKWHRENDYGDNYIEFKDYCLKARLKYSK